MSLFLMIYNAEFGFNSVSSTAFRIETGSSFWNDSGTESGFDSISCADSCTNIGIDSLLYSNSDVFKLIETLI